MLVDQNNLQDSQNRHLKSTGQMKAMEGEGMGGHNFGNGGKITPMGDDRDNPSRNAGYTNAYFAREAPMDEDTANNNFKAAHQQGEPDYEAAQKPVTNAPRTQETAGQQKVGDGDSYQESQQQTYQLTELDEAQPDHGSDSTETGEEREHIET